MVVNRRCSESARFNSIWRRLGPASKRGFLVAAAASRFRLKAPDIPLARQYRTRLEESGGASYELDVRETGIDSSANILVIYIVVAFLVLCIIPISFPLFASLSKPYECEVRSR